MRLRSAPPAQEAQAAPALGHRGDIEGLRGVAVALVVSTHLLGWPSGGFVGVDVFLVLSGYLITGLLLCEHQKRGSVRIGAFYARRAWRLLPAAGVVIAASVGLAYAVLGEARGAETLRDSVWAGLSLMNVELAASSSYFDEHGAASLLQHYWSLSVEEQFYLCWPVVMLVLLGHRGRHVWRDQGSEERPRWRVGVGIGALSLAGLGFSAWYTSVSPEAAYYSTLARSCELGAGAWLAWAHQRGWRPGRGGELMGLVGLGGIALGAWELDGAGFPGLLLIVPTACTLLVLHGGAGQGSGARVLHAGVVRGLGRISYPLYLWHWPLWVVASSALVSAEAGWERVLVGVGALGVSVGLAALTHTFVEEPLRRVGRRRGRQREVAEWEVVDRAAKVWVAAPPRERGLGRVRVAALGAIVLVSVLPGLVGLVGGPEQVAVAGGVGVVSLAQQQADVREALEVEVWGEVTPSSAQLARGGAPEWMIERCISGGAAERRRCRFGAGPRIAVLGDSYATSWVPGIRRGVGDDHEVQLLTRNECPVVMLAPELYHPSRDGEGCLAHQRDAHAWLGANGADVVILSQSPTTYEELARVVGTGEARAAWEAGLRASVRAVRGQAGRVVMLAAPAETKNLQRCRTRISSPRDCEASVTAEHVGLQQLERAVVESEGGVYVETTEWTCWEGRCPAVVDGVAVHIDGHHLSAAMSRRLAGVVEEVVLR